MDMKQWKKLLHENTLNDEVIEEGGPRRNPGEIWKKSGKYGAKNSAGDIQYFKQPKDAKAFVAGGSGEAKREEPKKEAPPKEQPKSTGKVDWETTLKKFKGKKGIPGEISKKYTNDHLKKAGFSDEDIQKYTTASLTSGGAKKLSKKDQKGFGKFKRMRDKFQKQMYALAK